MSIKSITITNYKIREAFATPFVRHPPPPSPPLSASASLPSTGALISTRSPYPQPLFS